MVRVPQCVFRSKRIRFCTIIEQEALRRHIRSLGFSTTSTSDKKPTEEQPLNDDDEEKPATKSLLSEIIQQQRELRPYLPPRRAKLPSDEETSLFFGTAFRSGADLLHSNIPMPSESSLFDVFQLPEPPVSVVSPERSPNAFPVEAVEQYWAILEPVLQSKKFQKKHTNSPLSDEAAQLVIDWLRSDEPALSCDLPTFQQALKEGVEPLQLGKERTFSGEVALQRKRFYTHFGLNEKQVQAASGAIFQVTNMCARNGKGLPLEVIWEKVKESGMTDKLLLHNLLYVSATFSTGSVRSRRKRRSKFGHLAGIASILDVLEADVDEDQSADSGDLVDLTDEIAIYHDLLYEPTEQSINLRVKLLVAQGKAKEAEQLLNEQSEGEAELRLRSYTPVLRLFLELDDLNSALRLYKKMRKMSTVHLDVETYIHVIAGIAEKGRFCVGAEPIASAKELGYKHMSGPGLFDELVEEMATELYEIPESSAKRLYNALASGFPNSGLFEAAVHSLKLSEELAAENQLFANRVRIDLSTGVCPRSGLKLRLIHLEEHEKEKLIGGILSLAKTQQAKYHENSKNWVFPVVSADQNLLEFYQWLDRRKGEPFTILVDGANVGYYNQNFEDGRFSYHQIKFVVDFLESLGELPLVILPNKYSKDWFYLLPGSAGSLGGRKQQLTMAEMAIRNDLWRREKLGLVPAGNLDDFYWILASVSSQTNSRRGRDLSVLPGNPKGQWPGTRPVLITNDQMRDHQIEMLEPMLFRRWYSNYIVNYNFAAFVDGVCTHPTIGFSPADFFSREIQGSNDANGSKVWHFPIAGKDDEWFCCRIPAECESKET